MKITCVIPARLESERFPKKVLTKIDGKPMLQWVWEGATGAKLFDDVVFAIDAEETAELIRSFGGRYIMTSPQRQSGTDRIIELMQNGLVDGDIWVNWQGDEPFIRKEMLEDLLKTASKDGEIWTLKKKIEKPEEFEDPNIVKVVCDVQGQALYFSRSSIPFHRDPGEKAGYKHLGLYAYTTESLKKIAELPYGVLESAERLEQLRFLEHGMKIEVHETQYETVGIDHPEDLENAHSWALSFNR